VDDVKILQFFLIGICSTLSLAALQPNPPNWPISDISTGGVFVFDPEDTTAQATINQIYAINGGYIDNGQFSSKRYALLFKPGEYANLTVPVGYYTSIIGLGKEPSDTKLFEVVCQQGNPDPRIGALNTFWRSAENFSMTPTKSYWGNGPICMLWAASQATALRRVHLTGANGNLVLYQYVAPHHFAGFSSGGFMADCTINGMVMSGSQQQWFTRNSDMAQWKDGVWNIVFLGCQGAPASHCGQPLPYTNVEKTPSIAEKPYIVMEASTGKYFLMLPDIEQDKIGSSQSQVQQVSVQSIDFEKVFVAAPTDSAATITSRIDEGYHIILTPGIYSLDDSIKINTEGLCLLGIGFPTLISTKGQPCITVGAASGIRIGGVLLEAGAVPANGGATPVLLQWGAIGDNPTNGFLYDCYTRVGGHTHSKESQVAADLMVQINSANIVCDNLWLWRADHDIGGLVENGDNPCNIGFQVNGNNVSVYGLAVEHTLQDLVQWNGDNGKTYFFQAEYPYDVTEAYATQKYVAYRVSSDVNSHHVWGAGVYCFFRDNPVWVNSGIITPEKPNIQFVNSLTVFLDGKGGILHVINDLGNQVDKKVQSTPAYYCSPFSAVFKDDTVWINSRRGTPVGANIHFVNSWIAFLTGARSR
jgi:hypothetical protein